MKTIDRLIIKAKKKCGQNRLIMGFISPSETDPNKWIARGDIWGDADGKGAASESRVCDSLDEAEAFMSELAQKYPNNKDVRIFIEDFEE